MHGSVVREGAGGRALATAGCGSRRGRPWVGSAFAIAAGIHLGAAVTHAAQWLPAAIGFAIVAIVQALFAVDAVRGPRFERWMIPVTSLVLAGWIISRTVGLPFTPLGVETITIHDGLATGAELFILGALALPARAAQRRRPRVGRSMRFAATGMLAVLGFAGTVAGPAGHGSHVHGSTLLAASAAGRALAADPDIHLHGISPVDDAGADPGRSTTSPLDFDVTPVDPLPSDLARGRAGSLWIAHRGGSVTRIAAGQPDLVRSIPGSPVAIEVAFGIVWVADVANDRVLALDERTAETLASIPVGVGPFALAATRDRVWVSTITEGHVQALDPVRLRAGAPVPVGFGPIALASQGSTLVVVNSLDRAIRVATTVGDRARFGEPIAVGAGASDVTITDDAYWVANASDGTVQRVDRADEQVIATLTVDEIAQPGLGPAALASRDGTVFVVNNQDRTVRAIEEATNTVSEPLFFGNGRSTTPTRQDVLVSGGDVVVTDFDHGTIATLSSSIFGRSI